MPYTITEGLAEIKTINKRIEKKREFVLAYMNRLDGLRDPLGDSRARIAEELQSINDLQERIIKIRSAIQDANDSHIISVGGIDRSISGWLVWRREVSAGEVNFNSRMRNSIASARQQAQQRGNALVNSPDQARDMKDVIVNVDEKEIAAQSEVLETILGQLDGLLSLKNATIMIEV